jgi:hypothetical protein
VRLLVEGRHEHDGRCIRLKHGSSATTTGKETAEIPDETAGPYPGDGPNGPNVLTESGIVRRDITTSFGEASGVARGIPTAIEMALLDVDASGTPMAGAAVYLWHCNIDGHYSMYDQDIADENYLRGMQESDSDGKVRFTSIFPAADAGRWPHILFEVYRSLDAATSAGCKAEDLADRPFPRRSATSSTRPKATSRAGGPSPRPRSTPTWASATATPASS